MYYFCRVNIHQKYIQRCIQLAKNGLGTTYPNPMVGSVIVHNNTIIGEGWHQKAGQPHAEVHAINSVKNKNLLRESTLYVSLEPCNHYGKTPPCSDLIVSHKIPKVVIGTTDPFVEVAGKGIQKLQHNGIEVFVGVLEKECIDLNKRFFTFHNKKRPYIILKWAESADRYMAPLSKEIQKPVWLSNKYSRQIVHKWRSKEQAILVGTKTVIYDNPQLTTRDWYGNNPTRIVLDKKNSISNSFAIKDNTAPTLIISEEHFFAENENCTVEKCNFDNLLPQQVVDILYQKKLQSVIIEGGKQTLQSFIDANLWDEARVFCSPIFFKNGLEAPLLLQKLFTKKQVQDDELKLFFNYD